jgi:mRNA interferase MazF
MWATIISKGNLQNLWRVNVLNVKRGEIYYADLSPVIGSEQGGIRHVLIVQNDVGNK